MDDEKRVEGVRNCVMQLLRLMEEDMMDDRSQFAMLKLFCEDCLDGKLGEFYIDGSFKTRR